VTAVAYKFIAFDVDGTLIDTEAAILAALHQMLLEETGRDYAPEELHFALGIPTVVTLGRLGFTDIERAVQAWDRCSTRFSHLIRVFPGVVETLQQLRDLGVTTGIVTSRTRAEIAAEVAPLGILPYFAHIISADDTERHKPNPEPVLKFLELAGARPEDALYVGDTRYDSQCAAAAGVAFGLALWGCKDAGVPCRHRLGTPMNLLRQ
jgi:HAD superfamily hydrolase (TIGR01549 family)